MRASACSTCWKRWAWPTRRRAIRTSCPAASSSASPSRGRWPRNPCCCSTFEWALLLLLDEPFSNLDVELRERLGAELRGWLAPTRTTALLVTHDQHEAFAIADEIGVMSEGRIQQWDNAYQLYHRPANRFVADFVGEGAFVPGEVTDGTELSLELGAVRSELPIRCTEHGSVCTDGCLVDVLLRPDDVVHDDDSAFKAEVVGKAFRGAEFLYTLRLPSGARVLSLVPSHHNHAIGEHIGIRLELDHVVAFRRGGR
jgi:iron(III) transport system ATP-binding protein